MSRTELASFALILLLAAGLRLAGITFDSLWLDESYQTFSETIAEKLPDFVHQSGQPFLFRFGPPQPLSSVIANFRSVDPLCPPLYAVLLNRWMTVFGQGDLAARSLSTLLSLVSLTTIYFLARAALNPAAARFAAILQAVSPFDIYYAQEARMYSLEMVAATVSCACLLFLFCRFLVKRDEDSPPPQGLWNKMLAAGVTALYAVATWALINSHYTALFIVLMQGLFATWLCLRHRNFRLFGLLVAAWLSVLLLWLPWFDLFRQAAAIRTESFYVARKASWWWPVWALVARIPFNWLVFLSGRQVVAYAVPVYFTSFVLLAAAARASFEKLRSGRAPSRESIALQFLWVWALLPPLVIWTMDVIEGHRIVEISRYLMATAPAVYPLAGYGLAALQAVRWAPALLVVHILFALVNNLYAHIVFQREPWREMATVIESQIGADEPLLVSQYYDIVCLDRYLTRPRVQYGVSPSLGAEHLAAVLAGHKRFWLLTAQEGESIKDMVPGTYKLTKQIDLRHALHLRLYEMAP